MAGRRLSDEEKSSAIDPLLLLDETDALGVCRFAGGAGAARRPSPAHLPVSRGKAGADVALGRLRNCWIGLEKPGSR